MLCFIGISEDLVFLSQVMGYKTNHYIITGQNPQGRGAGQGDHKACLLFFELIYLTSLYGIHSPFQNIR